MQINILNRILTIVIVSIDYIETDREIEKDVPFVYYIVYIHLIHIKYSKSSFLTYE